MSHVEPIRPTMFGPSAIRISYDDVNHRQLFTLPNDVQIFVPDEVAASEKFDPNPPSPTACYIWLSGLVVRSRIGHENLGERR